MRVVFVMELYVDGFSCLFIIDSTHPPFYCVIQLLADKDPGESVIRPSSRGPSYLTLTLKVYDGVFAHKDIIEGGKDHKDITSLLRIGKTLKIGEDTFEDLDEASILFNICFLLSTIMLLCISCIQLLAVDIWEFTSIFSAMFGT